MLSVTSKRIIALSTTAAVALGSCGGVMIYKNNQNKVLAQELTSEIAEAQDLAAAYHSLTSGKNETVYVITAANGERTTYVSSWLHNPDGSSSINDVSDLSDIEVVRGAAELGQDEGGQITWEANGEDVYYQGVSDDELPVDVNVSYTLDGASITEPDLEGRSGHLVMTIDYANNLSEEVEGEDGEVYTIYMPFVMTTGMLLDNDTYRNIEVTNGQCVNDGERTYVLGIGFPGLYESLGLADVNIDDPEIEQSIEDINIPDEITVECDVVDCGEITAMTVASVLDLNDIDISLNTDGINEDMDQITDGMRSLVDGSERLYDGVSVLNDGAVALNNGAGAVADGAASLATGASSLSNGTNELANGAASLQNGISQVNDGAAALNNGLGQVQANIPALQNGVNDLTNGANALSQGASSLSSGVNTLYSQMTSQEAQAQMSALVAGSAQFSQSLSALNTALSSGGVTPEQAAQLQGAIQYLSAYAAQADETTAACINALITAYSSMAGSMSQVASSVAALNEGYAGIDAGINALTGKFGEVANAVAQVQSGASQVANGAAQVSNGLNTLNNSTGALANGINQLASGSASLSNGTSQLVNGAAALHDGVAQVNNGAQALASGAASLSDGADQLASGTEELSEGVAALLEGAGQLEDGLNEFNEEAVDKLTDMINELSPVSDRVEALREYSATYNTFSGTPDGVEDSVVFVFKS